MTNTFNLSMRDHLFLLIQQKSYQYGEKITLASGKKSKHYFNMKPTMLDPQGAYMTANLMIEAIQGMEEKFSNVGGVELGAVPIASAIAPISFIKGFPLNAFIIRKQAKQHGTQSLIEGLQKGETLKGRNCLIVEDVTTTGGSAIKAIKAVREEGATVSHILTILDREEGAREAFAEIDVTLTSLFTKTDFKSAVAGGQPKAQT